MEKQAMVRWAVGRRSAGSVVGRATWRWPLGVGHRGADRVTRSSSRIITFALLTILFALPGCGGGGGGGAAPADIVGRILAVASGAPISGASVNISGVSATTAADGSFTLRNVSSAATQIQVTGTGLQALASAIGPLTPGAVNDLGDVFVLSTADSGGYTANVQAQVVRADTLEPVVGAVVLISGQKATTDASGNFSMTGLPVGLGTPDQPVGVIKAKTEDKLEDKPVDIDFPLVSSTPSPPGVVNDLGQIQMAPPVGGIPGGPFNIKGKVTLQGLADHSGTTVTLKKKATGEVVATVPTQPDGGYGFWVVAGSYTVTATHAGPPAFQTQTVDANLSKVDVPITVNMTLVP